MKVSIVSPCFNNSKFIAEMIESVNSQSYTNWERVIVDDCSTDGSVKIIETYVKKYNRIELITLDVNSGPAVSCNTAIDLASGRYIAFLDSDDLWLPSKLHKQIKFMEENSFPFFLFLRSD